MKINKISEKIEFIKSGYHNQTLKMVILAYLNTQLVPQQPQIHVKMIGAYDFFNPLNSPAVHNLCCPLPYQDNKQHKSIAWFIALEK